MTGPTEPEGELVVSMGVKQVHLRPAPYLKPTLCYQRTEQSFCWVLAIPRQVVRQLVVDAWLVDRPEYERSGVRSLIQSANLVIECCGDYSSLLMYDTVVVLSDSINTV